MEELCADECERLFYGGSSSSSFSDSVHFSSLFHVSHQPTMPSSRLFEEWMAKEENEAGMMESSLSRIFGDLFPDNLQLQLNRTDLQVSETEAEGTNLPQNEYSFHTETDYKLNDPAPPRALQLSLESASTLPEINVMNINLNDIFPQKLVAPSTSSGINANLPDLKKILVKKIILDKAVERLGGGKRGAERLWGLIQLWLSHQTTSFNLPLLSITAHQLAAASAGASLEEIEIQEFDAFLQNYAASPLMTKLSSPPPSSSSSSSSSTASIIKAGQHEAVVTLTLTDAASKSVQLTRSPEICASRARLIASAATTRAARKHVMAGRRRYMSHHLAPSVFPPSNSPHLPLRPARTTCHHTCQEPHFLFNERKVLKLERNLRLFLCKELKRSDVGSLDRIVLSKKESEYYLPNLTAREGISITMEDKTLPRMWNFRYREKQELSSESSPDPVCGRFWPNNKSRVYLLENTGDFVKSHSLEQGDTMMLYKDCVSGKYVIGGQKVAPLHIHRRDFQNPGNKAMKV